MPIPAATHNDNASCTEAYGTQRAYTDKSAAAALSPHVLLLAQCCDPKGQSDQRYHPQNTAQQALQLGHSGSPRQHQLMTACAVLQ